MTTPRHRVMQVRAGGEVIWATDELAGEEPLEIRVDGAPLAVTMRTPGADFDLAAGFLITEGIIGGVEGIGRMRMCPDAPGGGALNVVDVTLDGGGAPPAAPRNFYMTSSCGVCGKASIESVRTQSRYAVRDDPLRVGTSMLAALPATLRAAQAVFARTGGLHAAGLFDSEGALVCIREDVGRHNAFDKVVGWAAGKGMLPLRSQVILVSGRASFELIQKALMAGIPLLAAVSAPSNLAVALAEDVGITLVGFLRGDQMNVYAGHHRITRE